MVTARSPWCVGGPRCGAGPLLRVMALALLLFGVLVTHGASMEGAERHLPASATAPVAAPAAQHRDTVADPARPYATDAGDRHGGHEPTHPGDHCASGQPQQNSASAAPSFAASVRAAHGAGDPSADPASAAGAPADGTSPAALRAASVVRRT
ncbi:hypothetical protein AB0O01_09650 [Streptomyces sp. NPDC093252]|uniref:hypothetical protein n=1 Tax=Streptomyces sp. NPDC093252 TaxID=3154980 RepID=UPI00341727F4